MIYLVRKKNICKTLLTVILIVLSIGSSAQEIPFIPPVYNYTTNIYKAGNQNWAAEQGSNGVIYFGNENGLLSFDGVNWSLCPLPNNLSVKSIYIDNNHSTERIYVGSFEEFGYFERNRSNQLIYYSIKSIVEDYQFHNDEIWTIYPFDGKIYFQSFSAFFVFDGKEVRTFKPYPAVLYFFPSGDKMFAQMIDNDFCSFNGEDFQRLLTRKQLNNDDVVAVLPFDDDHLLVTSKSGLYRLSKNDQTPVPWHISIEDELREAIVNRAICAGDSLLLFGTLNSGLFAINKNGVKLWHINRNNGLNNNTVLALYEDHAHTIWAALDNGISNIRTNSPFTFFEPADIQTGLVEDILFFNNSIYIATNQGVYTYNSHANSFIRIPQLDIQSWFIKKFGKQIFVGHNLGTSLIESGQEVPIPKAKTGGMDIKQATINGKNILLESSYTSIYVYTHDESGDWTFSHPIDGFSDLIKNLEIDHAGNIWAGHMYKGVYRLKLDSDLQRVVEMENHLSFDTEQKSTLHPIKVMKLRGRVVFTDGYHFFTFDDIQRKIIPFDLLNHDLPDFADTYRIVPVNDDLFWFIRKTEYALVEFNQNRYSVKDRIPYSILNNPPNEGRANVYVSDYGSSYFCLNGGIGKYKLSDGMVPDKIDLQISSVTYHNRKNDQTLYLDLNKKAIIDFQSNDIGFQFMYPEFSKQIFRVECLLHGYDNRRVKTDDNLYIAYNNLPAGDYIMNAYVFNSSENELSSVSFSFKIKNPWYKTWWSYLLYFFFIGSVTGFLIKNHIQRIVHKKNKFFTEQENRRIAQIARQEKEITTLKNEKLVADLNYKSKELASATMMLINHSEFLKSLRADIQAYILAAKINRTEGNKLLKMIQKNLSEEDEWAVFQENFDLIHENFFRKLKKRYPSLTPGDLKLCTLLRLNYSSKDIAKLLNISIRGVEAARYRLRKKLQLDESENLVYFMMNFR